MKTFTEAVDEFIESATWLTPAETPMVVALQHVAAELDEKGTKAYLVNVFAVTHRALMKRGAQEGERDPLEALLENEDSED